MDIKPLECNIHFLINTPGSENNNVGWKLLYRSIVEQCISLIAENFSRESKSKDKIHIRSLISAVLSGSESARKELCDIYKSEVKICVHYDGDGLLNSEVKKMDNLPPATKATIYVSLALEDMRKSGIPINWCIHDVQYNKWQESLDKYYETYGMEMKNIDDSIIIIPEGLWDAKVYHTAYFKKGDPDFNDNEYNIKSHNYIGMNIEVNQGAWCKKYGGYDFVNNEPMGSTAAHHKFYIKILESGISANFYSIMSWDEELIGRSWELAQVGSSTEKAIKLGYFGDVQLRYSDATEKGDGWAKERFNLMDLNGDGKISLEEFRKAGGTSQMFYSLDRDKSGYLDEKEMVEIQL